MLRITQLHYSQWWSRPSWLTSGLLAMSILAGPQLVQADEPTDDVVALKDEERKEKSDKKPESKKEEPRKEGEKKPEPKKEEPRKESDKKPEVKKEEPKKEAEKKPDAKHHEGDKLAQQIQAERAALEKRVQEMQQKFRTEMEALQKRGDKDGIRKLEERRNHFMEEMKSKMQERMKQLHQQAGGPKSPSDKAPEKKPAPHDMEAAQRAFKEEMEKKFQSRIAELKAKGDTNGIKALDEQRQRMMEEFKKRMQDRMQQAAGPKPFQPQPLQFQGPKPGAPNPGKMPPVMGKPGMPAMPGMPGFQFHNPQGNQADLAKAINELRNEVRALREQIARMNGGSGDHRGPGGPPQFGRGPQGPRPDMHRPQGGPPRPTWGRPDAGRGQGDHRGPSGPPQFGRGPHGPRPDMHRAEGRPHPDMHRPEPRRDGDRPEMRRPEGDRRPEGGPRPEAGRAPQPRPEARPEPRRDGDRPEMRRPEGDRRPEARPEPRRDEPKKEEPRRDGPDRRRSEADGLKPGAPQPAKIEEQNKPAPAEVPVVQNQQSTDLTQLALSSDLQAEFADAIANGNLHRADEIQLRIADANGK
jgi:hypothetical protein